LLLVLVGLASACATTRGWALDEARTCERDAAPRVCVAGGSEDASDSTDHLDHGHVVALGDIELLPGECVRAADDAHAGSLQVTTRDPRDRSRRRWLLVRRGRITRLAIDERGRLEASRDRCGDRP